MTAKVWAPVSGDIVARFPARTTNRRWLKRTCQVKSPVYVPGKQHWLLPRNSLVRVIRASLDAFGCVEFYRDVKALTRCNRHCQEAQGLDCACSCLGAMHGVIGGREWVEVGESTLVAEAGDLKRIKRVMRPPGSTGEPRLYAGELRNRRYTTDPLRRIDWPKASEFLCSSCVTARATVWDHCHSHEYVRAPLCNKCNTWSWQGWSVEYGRTPASETVDLTYYGSCPHYDEPEYGSCTG